MELQFCGAAQEVTGSSHLITLDSGYKILLDCGLYQGRNKDMESFNRVWYFKPSEIDCVILSHAHIDHSGRLPKLIKDGFDGKIFCTHATRSLCGIMLFDSAKIQKYDADYFNKRQRKKKKRKRKALRAPLYDIEDVNETMAKMVSLGYQTSIQVNDEVSFTFYDAGHILGSASVVLEIKENGKVKKIGFSGDIGRPDRPILRDPVPIPPVDYLICESTYGDKEHLAKPDESEKLLDIIRTACVEKKGKLIIPAFSVGRTQEIVYILDQMEKKGLLPKIPIYVDSPLSVNATQIYGLHPECYDKNLNEYLLIDDNPFGFNALIYVRKVEVSKSLNDSDEPSIIISSSGMMNAGRVKHHLANNIEDEKNSLLIVGYCSPSTPGGMLKNGIEKIKLFGQWKQVNMEIFQMDSFSAHADRSEIYDFLKKQNKSLKHIFLVHGVLKKQNSFKSYLNKKGLKNISIPYLSETVKI